MPRSAAGALPSQLRRLVEDVRCGRLARRVFIQRMAAAGIGAPMAGLVLLDAGIAQTPTQTQPAGTYKPTRRGGGGALKLLYWQGPTLLNPHFATGQKDQEGSRLFYEPLVYWDADGNMQPVLAAEIPSRANKGVAADGTAVTWKLKPGVTWHDGAPFTADDLVFTFRYASDPATAAVTSGVYAGLTIEKIDALTVRVVFRQPTPFWPGTYSRTQILPRHLFADYSGAKSRDAPGNLKPVGTGPYRFAEFKPGDLLRGMLNPNYHMPNKPHFDSVELKGGGDSVSAARAVLQTGEYDFAWKLQVEDEVMKRLESGGKGRLVFSAAGAVEFIQLNHADPSPPQAGAERAGPGSTHPLFGDPAVRQAMALLVDRKSVQDFIYGRGGIATGNIVNNPARFRSQNTAVEFSIAKANAVLDAAGWQREQGKPDGVRAKGGRQLRLLFQTSTNPLRQKTQAIVKQAAQQAGIAIDVKAVAPSVYFSSDVGNPDTMSKFWADVQMYTNSMSQPDPGRFMSQFVSWELASQANKWQGLNLCRWRSDEFDKAFRAAEVELDPLRRAALFIRMNDLACNGHHVIPVVHRPDVDALARNLVAPMSGWDLGVGAIQNWYREAA